jgi:hypothetical protein
MGRADQPSMDLQEMALQQILFNQVQQLKTSAILIITSRQVSMMV